MDPSFTKGQGPAPKDLGDLRAPVSGLSSPRVVTIETVHYQGVGEQPTSYPHRSVRSLSSTEQVYQRRVTIGAEPVLVETGWVEDPAFVLVSNLRTTYSREPSPQEREIEAKRAVVVIAHRPEVDPEKPGTRTNWSPPREPAVDVPFALVLPGESFRVPLVPGARLKLVSTGSTSTVVVTAIPR